MKIQWLISGAAVALLAVPATASPARRGAAALLKLDADKYRHNYRGGAVHDKRDYRSLPIEGGATGTACKYFCAPSSRQDTDC